MQVIGIVQDGKYGCLAEDTASFFYVPFAQNHEPDMKLIVRTVGDPQPVLIMARNQALGMDNNMTAPEVQTIRQHIKESLGTERISVAMTAIFGLLSLAIVAVGLYAVVAYAVAQRAHELGIRIALGARHRDVLTMIIRRAIALVGAGMAAGTGLALALIPVLRLNIYGVKASDPASFAVAFAVLGPVTLLASYVPARHVLRLDPVVALRYE
jgi:ABC-type antimicrobial peptide transport system permease subunit